MTPPRVVETMDLIAELSAFDGKHVDTLQSLADRLDSTAANVRQLLAIAASDEVKLQTAATWVLKRLQENGGSYTAAQTKKLLDLLGQAAHWEVKLHLLQMLPQLTIPASHKDTLFYNLSRLLEHDNKFVRAWAYNGLAKLATQHSAYRSEVAEWLNSAQQDEAASVKARIRNVLKTIDWA